GAPRPGGGGERLHRGPRGAPAAVDPDRHGGRVAGRGAGRAAEGGGRIVGRRAVGRRRQRHRGRGGVDGDRVGLAAHRRLVARRVDRQVLQRGGAADRQRRAVAGAGGGRGAPVGGVVDRRRLGGAQRHRLGGAVLPARRAGRDRRRGGVDGEGGG